MSGPLAGLKIIDLSQVIAGPYASAVLTHAGADVIKVEVPAGEIGRTLASGFLGYNRGKRAICLNLQSDEGRQVLHKLVAGADILIQNFRPGVVERLHADYLTLSRINPRLVYVSITAFGPTGPYSHRPGFDPLLQAMTGIERAQGGQGNPPVFLRIAITDFTTSLMIAAATTMALYEREKTGRGQHIQTSLLRSGIFINAEAFTRYPGRPARILPDAGQHGLGPLDRMYRTSDGWLYLYLQQDESSWKRLAAVEPFLSAVTDPKFNTAASRAKSQDELAAVLETIFVRDMTEAWLARLEESGIPCAPVIEGYSRSFFEDVQPVVNGYAVGGEHAERGYTQQPGNYIHYSDFPTSQEGLTAPVLGQHTDEVLAELGYSQKEIALLRASGSVA